MLCFNGSRSSTRAAAAQTQSPTTPPPQSTAAPVDATAENSMMRRRNNDSPTASISESASSSAPSPTGGSGGGSSRVTAINLLTEYSLSLQTNSYNEIWSKIHHHDRDANLPTPPSLLSPSSILQPDRASMEEALLTARPTQLTSLVSRYFDSSEQTSHLFLSLRRSVDSARSIYSPLSALIDVLSPTAQLSQSQCDSALQTFLHFEQLDNPFPAPSADDAAACSFDGMRYCFAELKQQLDLRLRSARRRHRLLRRITRGSAACLVLSVAAAAVAGVLFALTALAASAPAVCCGGRDPLAGRRRKLREHMSRVDAAARETYVLNNHLATIERLVAKLHATVESDRVLVQIGAERARGGGGGGGQHHPIQEVLRHLRRNQPSFLHQLSLLDEHICLCLAAVNRSRSLLLQQIHC